MGPIFSFKRASPPFPKKLLAFLGNFLRVMHGGPFEESFLRVMHGGPFERSILRVMHSELFEGSFTPNECMVDPLREVLRIMHGTDGLR